MFNTASENLLDIWKTRRNDIQGLAKFINTISTEWFVNTPSNIAPSTGSVHVALLEELMGYYGMCGRDWVAQFIYGFPIIGFSNPERGGGASVHRIRK